MMEKVMKSYSQVVEFVGHCLVVLIFLRKDFGNVHIEVCQVKY